MRIGKFSPTLAIPMTLHWHTEPLLLAGLLIPAWLYALWVWPLRPAGVSVPGWRIGCFFGALILSYLAVGSPLDQIGEDYLFSAHMLQHLILMYVTPILFVIGLPPDLVDRFLSRHPLWVRVFRKILHPVSTGVVFSLCFSLWHVPSLYEAALAHKSIHILEHLTIWIPGLGIAWNLFSPSRILPTISYPGRLLMLFILMVAQLPVFGILTMSGNVLYPTYEWAPRIIDLSPIDDQVLGGLLMKVGGMLFVLPIFGYCFYQWSKTTQSDEMELEADLPPHQPEKS
ncbi:MAG: cytochrome c oxidase assembly protein [Puniceicoccales bacterium]